ncbi:hypothetical protein TWF481_006990 [Arthrobotrys musiformis]|uniref:NACHT domain-containing protein n=1 Tax=Arthrobotrys musiformis TaxID=47236 RepID=A0AAV9WFV3_9PEZI
MAIDDTGRDVFNNTACRIGFQGTIINHGHINTDGQDKSEKLRARKSDVLQKLYKTSYQDHKDRNPDRVPGTCEWFVAHERFREWQESKSTALWVSADPGCGKSVLAKYLIDSVLTTTKYRTTCYFFFKDDVEDQKSVVNALCCILHQIFRQKIELLSEDILERFEVGGKIFSSFTELWGTLLAVAENNCPGAIPSETGVKSNEIVCLFDAIDECERNNRTELLKALRKLDSSTNAPNLKFLLISRPYGDIRHGLTGYPRSQVIHLSGETGAEAEGISSEIDIFIKARVEDIGIRHQLEPEDEDLLLRKLMSTPHRTYLWVYLTLDLIEREINIDSTGISEAITQVSQTVDGTYEKILSKSRDFEKAKKLLQIVVAAVRPLSPEEMCLALALKDNHQSYGDLRLEEGVRFRQNIREICGFLIIIKDSRIYLLHQTLKEFLLRESKTPQLGQTNVVEWKCTFQLHDAHGVLANICVRCLLFREFEDQPLEEEGTGDTVDEYVKNYVFLDYSAKHWTIHLHESKAKLDPTAPEYRSNESETKSILKLCDTSSKRYLTWFRVYWATTKSDFPKGFTTLMLASYFGLITAILNLLERDIDGEIDLDSEDETYGRTALSWAAENGFDYVVELLLGGIGGRWKGISLPFRKGVDVNSTDTMSRTPIVYAVLNGHVTTVDLLLKAGASIDQRDDLLGTPLAYGLFSGNRAISVLVSIKAAKAKIEFDEREIHNMLFLAVSQGNTVVLKLILKTGKADLNFKYTSGGRLGPLVSEQKTLLSNAIFNSDEDIVSMLLETGQVDPNIVGDERARAPLSLAVLNGDENICKLLLATQKVDANLRDVWGMTPLLYATKQCYELEASSLESQDESSSETSSESLIKLLVESGQVDPNIADNKNRTPLLFAVRARDEGLVRFLLSVEKTDPNLGDDERAPLSYAAQYGYDTIVKLLLQTKKVDPNCKDKSGRTPLLYAIIHGYESVARLLLATKKVDPDSRDTSGETPLLYAARQGNETIVKLLLETGKVDLGYKNGSERTPLLYAAEYGYESIARLLIDTQKVDLNVTDKFRRTPLLWALKNGHDSIASLLIEAGCKIDFVVGDTKGDTPLSYASRSGDEAVVKLLLKDISFVSYPDMEKPFLTKALLSPEISGIVEFNFNRVKEGLHSALLDATASGFTAVVKLLLEEVKIHPGIKDEWGQTLLSVAARNGRTATVQLLLEMGGFDIDSTDGIGWAALSHAVARGHAETARTLLDKGASLNPGGAVDYKADLGEAIAEMVLEFRTINDFKARSVEVQKLNTQCPLSIALDRCNLDITSMLLQRGANIELVSKSGRTPLDYTSEGTSVFQLLESYYIDKMGQAGWAKILETREEIARLITAKLYGPPR